MKMKRLFPVFLVILVGLLSTQAYGDGFNPGPGEYRLSGPAILGSATIEAVAESCTPGSEYPDVIKFSFFGNCKGAPVSFIELYYPIKKCFDYLGEEDLEGFALPVDVVIDAIKAETWPVECLPKGGPGPLMIETVTKFVTSTGMPIHAEVVLLFLVAH
jgi:hypothetical protein